MKRYPVQICPQPFGGLVEEVAMAGNADGKFDNLQRPFFFRFRHDFFDGRSVTGNDNLIRRIVDRQTHHLIF